MLALAEAGQGVAIIPSCLRTDRYALRIFRVTHLGAPLQEGLVIQWDKRRPLPPYAESFCQALGGYMRESFRSRNRRKTGRGPSGALPLGAGAVAEE